MNCETYSAKPAKRISIFLLKSIKKRLIFVIQPDQVIKTIIKKKAHEKEYIYFKNLIHPKTGNNSTKMLDGIRSKNNEQTL